tara:strand:- start:774 stop:4034 length:3261 start_codon:yes stop_codon:yes gene_type:complete
MNGKNIPEEIRRGLDARLEAMSTFGEKTLKSPALGTVSEETEEFRLSREAVENCSPFIRMIGSGVGDSFYVMSGMFNTDSNPEAFEAIQSDINYINTRPSTSNLTGAESYYELGKGEDIREKRFGYKEPGINTLSVTNLTDGAKGGAVKQAVVQFTVWRMNQLDDFQRHSFLSLGATVILDWGWIRGDKSVQSILEPPSIVVKEGDKVSLDFNLFLEQKSPQGETLASAWTKQSRLKYGDWDGLIGVVAKVDWKINEEGAFECEAVIQGKGSHAFSDPIAIKERHNSIPPLYASDTGIQDFDTFRYAWMKKAAENVQELTPQEQKALDAGSLEEALSRARTGPEVSLIERLASLDVEIITKLFDKIKNEQKSDSEPKAVISNQNEAAMIYKPYQRIDEKGKPTGEYAVGVLSQDQDTKEFYKNTQFQYEMWINWGWFEDNVISYYSQKFGSNAKGSAVFRSIQIVDKGLRAIAIANNPNLYTFTNDFILPGQTPTNWIPSEVGDKKNSQVNPYKALAQAMNERVDNFALEGNPDMGYLRNIYVNINLIKGAFSSPGISISGGMLALADSLNRHIKLWDFDLKMTEATSIGDRAIPMTYSIVETRQKKEYFGSDVLDPGKSYIFENNGLNSLIQSCDISTDISSRLGAAAYMGRQSKTTSLVDKVLKQNERPFADQEEVMNLARFYNDPLLGSVRQKADPLNLLLNDLQSDGENYNKDRRFYYGAIPPLPGFGNIVNEISDDGLKDANWNHDIAVELRRVYPTALGARLEQSNSLLKQLTEQGNADIDPKKFVADNKEGIKEEVKELGMYGFPPTGVAAAKIDSEDSDAVRRDKMAKFPYQDGFNMHYNWLRTLDFYLSENPVTSLLQESGNNDVVFLPIKATITIDGIGGMNLLDMFRLSYLPKLYKQEGDQPGTYFLIIGLSHTINDSGWTTEITGQIQVDNSRFLNPLDADTEEKLKTAMEEAFEELWGGATEESTADPADEPQPAPAPDKPPPRVIIEPEEQILNPIIYDPADEDSYHRIGDRNTRVVDFISGPQDNIYELFKYDNLDQFMSSDNLEVDTSVFDTKGRRFPDRVRGSGDEGGS